MFGIQVHVLASGSDANCYLLEAEESFLLLDAGVPVSDVRKKTDYNLDKLEAVLLSHEHKDHSKYVEEYLQRGIPVFASEGTKKYINLPFIKAKKYPKFQKSKTWKWTAFDLEHDAEEPLGFMVQHNSGKKVGYVTDTGYIEPKLDKLDYLLIECNYTREKLDANKHREDLGMHVAQKKRIFEEHLGLQDVLNYLEMIDIGNLKEIHLIHISKRNGNPKKISQSVKEKTKVPVYVH